MQVTTDINVYAHICGDIAIISTCVEAVVMAWIGPLTFSVVFGFMEFYKVFMVLMIGVLNVSAFLQYGIITNQRYGWIKIFE